MFQDSTEALRVATWDNTKKKITVSLALSSGCQFLWIWLFQYWGGVTEESRLMLANLNILGDLTSTGKIYRGLPG